MPKAEVKNQLQRTKMFAGDQPLVERGAGTQLAKVQVAVRRRPDF
jgi:hypothetical protein